MTITKLVMSIDKGWRYNPTEVSYHINDEVAERYAQKKIAEGKTEKCVDYATVGYTWTAHYNYSEHYSISHMEVNEE